jgi:hypothetical protein
MKGPGQALGRPQSLAKFGRAALRSLLPQNRLGRSLALATFAKDFGERRVNKTMLDAGNKTDRINKMNRITTKAV